MNTPEAVYIHIPFCRRRCPYCDFVSNALDRPVPQDFVDALCAEIHDFGGSSAAGSVFLGGGTPSLLSAAQVEEILEAVRTRFTLAPGAEVSAEANPDDVSMELLARWRGAGVNRVSLGVQSFDDTVLAYLGRRHDAEGARRACAQVADTFCNWSLDLIFGAHPVTAWSETLREAVGFSPPHVSAYGLTYEAGTALGTRGFEAVDDDYALQLYRRTRGQLRRRGYEHYEVSNFARPGSECRHNLVYWRNEAYVGFGPAAYSYRNRVRARNPIDWREYVATPGHRSEAIELTDREERLETVIQHMRLGRGLSLGYYRERFGGELDDDFGDRLADLTRRGLVTRDAKGYRPTPVGFELNNEIGLRLVGD